MECSSVCFAVNFKSMTDKKYDLFGTKHQLATLKWTINLWIFSPAFKCAIVFFPRLSWHIVISHRDLVWTDPELNQNIQLLFQLTHIWPFKCNQAFFMHFVIRTQVGNVTVTILWYKESFTTVIKHVSWYTNIMDRRKTSAKSSHFLSVSVLCIFHIVTSWNKSCNYDCCPKKK